MTIEGNSGQFSSVSEDTEIVAEDFGNKATPGIPRADLEALEERLTEERERLRAQLEEGLRNAEAAADEKAAAAAAAVTAATAFLTAEIAQAREDAERNDEQNDANVEAMDAAVREERERALRELRAQFDQAVENTVQSTETFAEEQDALRGSPGRPTVPHFLAAEVF